jgi:hypothetical protein
MKKPALIETAVRLFPDKEYDAAATPATIKSRITDPPSYYFFKGKEAYLSRIPYHHIWLA